jgi:hypothetical protein
MRSRQPSFYAFGARGDRLFARLGMTPTAATVPARTPVPTQPVEQPVATRDARRRSRRKLRRVCRSGRRSASRRQNEPARIEVVRGGDVRTRPRARSARRGYAATVRPRRCDSTPRRGARSLRPSPSLERDAHGKPVGASPRPNARWAIASPKSAPASVDHHPTRWSPDRAVAVARASKPSDVTPCNARACPVRRSSPSSSGNNEGRSICGVRSGRRRRGCVSKDAGTTSTDASEGGEIRRPTGRSKTCRCPTSCNLHRGSFSFRPRRRTGPGRRLQLGQRHELQHSRRLQPATQAPAIPKSTKSPCSSPIRSASRSAGRAPSSHRESRRQPRRFIEYQVPA